MDGKTASRTASRGTAAASVNLSRSRMAACPSVASAAPPGSLVQEIQCPGEGLHPFQEMYTVRDTPETFAPLSWK